MKQGENAFAVFATLPARAFLPGLKVVAFELLS
jgi:hypothetical protein